MLRHLYFGCVLLIALFMIWKISSWLWRKTHDSKPTTLPGAMPIPRGTLIGFWILVACLPEYPISPLPAIFYILITGVPSVPWGVALSLNMYWIQRVYRLDQAMPVSWHEARLTALLPTLAVWFCLLTLLPALLFIASWGGRNEGLIATYVSELALDFMALRQWPMVFVLFGAFMFIWIGFSMLMRCRDAPIRCLLAGPPIAISGYVAHAILFFSLPQGSFVGLAVPFVATPLWAFVAVGLATTAVGVADLFRAEPPKTSGPPPIPSSS